MTLAAVAPGCGPRGLDEEPALRVVESPFVDALRSDTDREPATFCIEPIRNRSEVIEDGDPRLSSLDEAIRDAFVEMGFAVADFEAYDAMRRDAFIQADPPAWDPLTGDYSVAGFEAATTSLRTRAQSELGCDAFVRPSLVLTRAPWIGAWADWDGTGVRVADYWSTSSNVLYAIIKTLSFHLSIEDGSGLLVYFGTGGIEPLFELNGPAYDRDAYGARNIDTLLVDPEVIADAARKATAELRPAETP